MRIQLGSDLLVYLGIKDDRRENGTLDIEVVHVFHQRTFAGKSEK
jgi:hypothetical protein